MHGLASDREYPYALEMAIIERTGWTLREVAESPADLIDTLVETMNAEHHWKRARDARDKASKNRKPK